MVPGSYLVATGDYAAFVTQHGYVGAFVPAVSAFRVLTFGADVDSAVFHSAFSSTE